MPIEPFQARVAQLALSAAAAHGFALAGGNALAAHGLLSRPTEPADGGRRPVLPATRRARPRGGGGPHGAARDGFAVQVVRSPAEHGGEFAQLQVSRDGHTTLLDLARDWRAHKAVTLAVGPVLHLDDALGAKVTALLGRGLVRDFIDIAAALEHTSRARLLELGFARDPGLRVEDAALVAQRLDQLADTSFLRYGLHREQVAVMRARYAGWPREQR